MNRVRPSSLGLAAFCARAPWLSAKHNESRPVTRRGSDVDRQVSYMLAHPCQELPEELLPEAGILLDWVALEYPSSEWEWHPQLAVELNDPATGELLTKGTLDLLCVHRTRPKIAVIDWKKKGQLWAGHLPPPDRNPQQRAYIAAAWLKVRISRKLDDGEIVLACWDERGVKPLRNLEPITAETIGQIIEEVRAIPPLDLDSPQPEASIGDHCDHCYQRMHCDAHLLPAAVVTATGLAKPGQFAQGAITAENVQAALIWVNCAEELIRQAKQIVEMVGDNIDAFVKQTEPVTIGEMTYGPVPVKGKRLGATVATLEKEGLHRLIREGKESVACKWYPALKKPGTSQIHE